ncbi:MAG: SLC13 family permease [Deltaproteobacteria bacterium]|nr:SLC13 family permease [Deltaproteobacteria bacterium]
MTPPDLDADMILVLLLIGAAVFLFIVEWIRVDVVAILMMVLLPMLGLISGTEAFSGLSSNAVVSIIAVIIIGRGLDHTRVVNRMIRPVLRLSGNSRVRVLGLLSITVALVSGFMQNIGAAALFLPAVRRISRRTHIPIPRILMPVGFAAILGGTITLVGSSPLILLNDLMKPHDLAPFHLFTPMPVGLVLVGAGVLYFLLLGRWVLPRCDTASRAEEPFDPTRDYPQVGRLFELVMPRDPLQKPLVRDLCDDYWTHVVALSTDQGKTRFLPPERDAAIPQKAVLAVYGPPDRVRSMADTYDMTIKPELDLFKEDLSSDLAGVVEAVVTPRSKFVGKSMAEITFRRHHHVTPLAVMREDRIFYTHLGDIVLRPGDAVLMHGAWERFHHLSRQDQFVYSHPIDHEIMEPQKAAAAVACFALSIGLVIFTDLLLSVCLMTGALGMVLTRVLTIDQAYRSVDWRTIFLLAGLIPLGLATQKSGAAAFLAYYVLDLLGRPTPLMLYLVVGGLSTLFTLVISNVGAVVLLVPLVVPLARAAEVDPRLAVLVVGLATSNSFLIPTHQVNALYMGPGRYRSRDYLRAGAGMSLVFVAVVVGMILLVYS